MTKEELLNTREIIKNVQQKRSIENVILAYQTTIDLELQYGKEAFLSALFQRVIIEEEATVIMRKTDKVDYNFRNRMLHKYWETMLNSQRISSSESKMLLLDPSICPYDDIFLFEFSPILGGNSIEGYIRKQRLLKSLETLGFTSNDFKHEENLFQITAPRDMSRAKRMEMN